jgi:transposase
MGKPYSIDLRERLVAAVLTGGMSCNRAAKQFGVGISTAINWVNRQRETGSVAPGQMGGHKPKAISGEYRIWLLQRIKDRDFTLRGLVAELAERGLKVDYRSVWEFVHAEKLSREGSPSDTLRPGDIVIMDNLGSHKSKAVRQLIRSVGAKLFFLPKYSPELNPIEQVFAKLKHFLRQAAARTVEAVCAVIGEILQAFTPQECANYFQNSGYSLT